MQIQGRCLFTSINLSATILLVSKSGFLVLKAWSFVHYFWCFVILFRLAFYLKPHFSRSKSKFLALCGPYKCQVSTLSHEVRFFPVVVRSSHLWILPVESLVIHLQVLSRFGTFFPNLQPSVEQGGTCVQGSFHAYFHHDIYF